MEFGSIHPLRERMADMVNREKYIKAFVDTFSVDPGTLEGLAYQGVSVWDSVGHMGLIAALEEAFDIQMETEDIIEFSSFAKGKELLKKYNVVIE